MEILVITFGIVVIFSWLLARAHKRINSQKAINPVAEPTTSGSLSMRVIPTAEVVPITPPVEKPSPHFAVVALCEKYGRTMVITRDASSVTVALTLDDGTTLRSTAKSQYEAVDNLVSRVAAYERSMK